MGKQTSARQVGVLVSRWLGKKETGQAGVCRVSRHLLGM